MFSKYSKFIVLILNILIGNFCTLHFYSSIFKSSFTVSSIWIMLPWFLVFSLAAIYYIIGYLNELSAHTGFLDIVYKAIFCTFSIQAVASFFTIILYAWWASFVHPSSQGLLAGLLLGVLVAFIGIFVSFVKAWNYGIIMAILNVFLFLLFRNGLRAKAKNKRP